jgi:hypothetical protein
MADATRRTATPAVPGPGAGATPGVRHRRGHGGRQIVALGQVYAGKTITIDVTDTELLVSCDD